MNWLKKYSIQLSIATSLAGVVISVMPYFEAYLAQWQVGLIMAAAGFFTAIGRMIPQGGK
ncbi:hypothetical protein [Vibrio phage vB_ValP_IME234]|nr:hypothetical protein [Vibrio phage vB_VpP_BA6]QUE30175.1 hypothetical protein [Vibrio phage vB_ValP_IME234]